VDSHGLTKLLAAIIEQAVTDRRQAAARGLLDADNLPTRELSARETEICSGLKYFFEGGGLEIVAREAGFNLPIKKIKEKANEPTGRKRCTTRNAKCQ
jgi:hypothetical protein